MTNFKFGGNHIRSFSEKESLCEFLFNEALKESGPFWHVCTPGNLQEIINTTEEDFRFSVSNLAISSFEAGVKVVTDAHMENHLHALSGGTEDRCKSMMNRYICRLSRYLDRKNRDVDLSGLKDYKLIPVTDLEMMRDEIAYINRNGYVDDERYLPFSYPWGGGYLYFNPLARMETATPFNNIPFREKRAMTLSRVMVLPERYAVSNGMILPSSYTDFKLGEFLFRDAHHYFSAITRKVEAYSKIAKRMGDSIVLSREEMFRTAKMISKRYYNIDSPSLLPPDAKIEVARIMYGDYRASNAQIRMILKLSQETVDALFPLKALGTKHR